MKRTVLFAALSLVSLTASFSEAQTLQPIQTMFTLEQIKAVHSKVKSGADFPLYVQDMKKLGVHWYEHFLTDGHCTYHGGDSFFVEAPAKWALRDIHPQVSKEKLNHDIREHQQGKSDYHTICMQLAEAGVQKWIVDMRQMTCTYYDAQGNTLLVEEIPAP